MAALRRCALLAGRARAGEDDALDALVEALDPLHPLLSGGRPGPGASPVSSSWDAVGDHLAAVASAGLVRSQRQVLAGSLELLLRGVADRLEAHAGGPRSGSVRGVP